MSTPSPNLAKMDQIWPFGQIWSILTKFSQKINAIPKFDLKFEPNLADQMPANDQILTKFGPFLAQIWP